LSHPLTSLINAIFFPASKEDNFISYCDFSAFASGLASAFLSDFVSSLDSDVPVETPNHKCIFIKTKFKILLPAELPVKDPKLDCKLGVANHLGFSLGQKF
jgi:hypothetical protein